jgi:Beta-propeller repeat
MIAVDTSGRVAITGTTTSADFPVTDGSTRSTGPNDVAVVELAPTATTLVYSTLFGGSGSESTQSPGGIALDQAGEIFVASDTTSTNLPVTTGAFQPANGGGTSDNTGTGALVISSISFPVRTQPISSRKMPANR